MMIECEKWLRAWLCLLTVLCVDTGAASSVDFVRDIQPILSENCYFCHGPDAQHREGKLRLDVDSEAKRKAIVPGDVNRSPLLSRVTAKDADELMPPPESGKVLSPSQIGMLRQWIAEGAEYREHWAFAPPRRPVVPESPGWGQNAIDAFVLKRMKVVGLSPNPEAGRETLIRRVSLALTGLPPTPGEVDAFLTDPAPDAYERLIDRLLKSERYGERMAMWWLDGARYADSHGFQADWERYQWPWRDWVIRAFNRNQPFDRFTIEQLAGDLLPDAGRDQILATGFNRNHRVNTEGGSLNEEWLVENVIDRVETMGSVWLGLTLNCARCHDHKYDPVSQRDFYQFFAYFHNVPEQGKGPGRQGNFDPILKLPSDKDKAETIRLDAAIADAGKAVKGLEESLNGAVRAWEDRIRAGEEPKGPWRRLDRAEVESRGGAEILPLGDGSFLPSGKQEKHDVYTVTARPGETTVAALLLEAIPDASMVEGRLGRAHNGNFVLSGVEVELLPAENGEAMAAKIVGTEASYEQKGWPAASLIDSSKGRGWAVDGNTRIARRQLKIVLGEPMRVVAGSRLRVRLKCEALNQHALGRFRLFTAESAAAGIATGEGLPDEIREVLNVPPAKRSAKQREVLRKHVEAAASPELVAARKQLERLKKEKADLEKRIPSAMVMSEMEKPRETRVLVRGQYDQPSTVVSPGLPVAFAGALAEMPTNRLGLAEWIVSPSNPLTARVQVNRLWELLFGAGIVTSSENFGLQAEFPSHPDLLDWLAHEFVQKNWNVKAMLKLMLTSAAYRQDAATDIGVLEADPANRWLARGPRFRIQAEMVRDQALYLGGLLVEKIGGPSVYPYQPAGIWSEFNFYGNLRNYQHAKDDGLYRRSLYTIWKRTAAPPGMTLFDMPNREICTVKRPRTNTPLQALALMNDVTYVEAARGLAERMLNDGESVDEQIRAGFRRVTSRRPTEVELNQLRAGYERRLRRFEEDEAAAKELLAVGESGVPEDMPPARLAAMTTVASVLLNLDETINN